MKITINDNRKIFAIQEVFTKEFPYLKMEFFTKPHTKGGGSSKKNMSHSAKTLGECRTEHNSGIITILGSMTVTELEQRFADVFGLCIQVFRRSGKVWLETTVTDGWTLDQQNAEAQSFDTYLATSKLAK